MSQSSDLTFQQKSLFQQGYQQYSAKELKQLEWGLRFTPAVCSVLTAIALLGQSPVLLFVVAALGIWAFFFPAGHPMDLLYNHFVRHMFKSIKLPQNPFQRRLACFAAGVMNAIAAVLLLSNLPVAAWIVGGVLLALQAIVISTHFCTLSWMYEGVMRLFGQWNKPVEQQKANQLLSQGAIWVDVRSPNEYSKGSVSGSINLPLEELENNIDKFKAEKCLLFCNSGTRSHIAHKKLENLGITHTYNIGTLTRAQNIANASV